MSTPILSPADVIALSNLKDFLGLIGTGLIAIPFFRLEKNKRDAKKLSQPPTTDAQLAEDFRQAGEDTKQAMDQPSAPDYLATLWGLGLLGLSFLISILMPYVSS